MTAYKQLESAYDSLVAIQADYLSNPTTNDEHAANLGAAVADLRVAINELRMQSLKMAQEAIYSAFTTRVTARPSNEG